MRGKKEEEKVKEEEEVLLVPKITGEIPEKEWCPPSDPNFSLYVSEVTKTILPITNMKEKIEALAKYVAEKMGGPIIKEKLHEFSWELHISELKFQLKSNVIPVGHIKKGIFYHRALLFKALADRTAVGSSLVRGQYGRAWNEVKLIDKPRKGVIWRLPPEKYIVDLMFCPGVSLSNDFIAGFCGETEEDDLQTVSLLREVQYNIGFLFAYSMRQKTRAYHRLQDDVPEVVKLRRLEELITVFREEATKANKASVGSAQLVLVEGLSKRSSTDLCGRNDGNLKVIFPDIEMEDATNPGLTVRAQPGDYVLVKITSASSQTLKGHVFCKTTLKDSLTYCSPERIATLS